MAETDTDERVGREAQIEPRPDALSPSVFRTQPVDRQCPATRVAKARNRSRVSNGEAVLPNVDGRSLVARRFRDIVAQIAVDQGGADRLSEAKMQLVRRFSAACVLAEMMEARLANGEEIDIAEHASLSSTLVRIAQRIGINRSAKTVPSLRDYLAESRVTIETESAE